MKHLGSGKKVSLGEGLAKGAMGSGRGWRCFWKSLYPCTLGEHWTPREEIFLIHKVKEKSLFRNRKTVEGKVLSYSVMSDSLRRHRLYSPGNRPGQNTGVGSLSLLQGIFPTQGSNPGLPHCGRILYLLSHQVSPRILAWVASPFSSGPRSGTGVSCTASLVDSSPSHTHSPRRLRVRGRGLQCRLAA